MKKFSRIIKSITMAFAGMMPFKTFRNWAAKDLVIINYHSIKGWDPDPIIRNKVYRTEEQLENDLQFYQKHFTIISVGDLLYKKKLPANALLITIDDGLKVVFDKMYPLFKKYTIPAVVFVNSDFIDNKDLHFLRKRNYILDVIHSRYNECSNQLEGWMKQGNITKEDLVVKLKKITYSQSNILAELSHVLNVDFTQILKDNPVYLSETEIQQMKNDGFGIGAHSVNHPFFEELSLEEQIKQVKESVDWVVKQFDLSYRIFAFPSDDRQVSLELFDAIVNQVDVTFGVQGLKSDKISTHYHRIEVEATGKPANQVLKYEFIKHIYYRLIGKSIILRSSIS